MKKSGSTHSTSSKKRTGRYKRLKQKPGQAETYSVLNDYTEKRVLDAVRGGHSLECAAAYAGIDRTTIYNWRAKGQEDPTSRYGEFNRKIEFAISQSKLKFVQQLYNDPNPIWKWKMMKCKWPKEFFEVQHTEISGPDQQPIAVNSEARYTVKVICSAPFPEFPSMPVVTAAEEHEHSAGNGNGSTRQ